MELSLLSIEEAIQYAMNEELKASGLYQKMSEKKKNRFGKWLIFFIGLIFTVYAVMMLTLLFFGEQKQALLTSYRQEYGERNETIRNRYTYHFGYEFTVDGKKYSGTGQKIGSPIYLNPGPESTISVKYLKGFPFINSHVDNDNKKTSINILVCFSTGIILFLFFRKM